MASLPSKSLRNKIKIDEHASRSVADTETKPATATRITGRKDLFDIEDLARFVPYVLLYQTMQFGQMSIFDAKY